MFDGIIVCGVYLNISIRNKFKPLNTIWRTSLTKE